MVGRANPSAGGSRRPAKSATIQARLHGLFPGGGKETKFQIKPANNYRVGLHRRRIRERPWFWPAQPRGRSVHKKMA